MSVKNYDKLHFQYMHVVYIVNVLLNIILNMIIHQFNRFKQSVLLIEFLKIIIEKEVINRLVNITLLSYGDCQPTQST